jgi:hypothetical protein
LQQGYSGSIVQRKGKLVEKVSSDQSFIDSQERQRDLVALSQQVPILPRIDHIASPSIFMEYVDGQEGLTKQNAAQAGKALRLLHEQQSYPHACMTGLNWLIELANDNLGQMSLSQRISNEITNEYPSDTLIHSEPTQLIEKKDGKVVFIDFEGIGMGSRYQDLGFIYWRAILGDQPDLYTAFLQGYQADSICIELRRVKQLAGLISLAYVGFALAYAGPAEAEKRLQLGLRLLGKTG